MTRPNITPGHWQILSKLNDHMICDKSLHVLAVTTNGNEEPNARAIAAVPALLEALEMAHSWIIGRLPEGKTSSQCIQQMRDALTAAGYQF